jgi:hypothetical protein
LLPFFIFFFLGSLAPASSSSRWSSSLTEDIKRHARYFTCFCFFFLRSLCRASPWNM